MLTFSLVSSVALSARVWWSPSTTGARLPRLDGQQIGHALTQPIEVLGCTAGEDLQFACAHGDLGSLDADAVLATQAQLARGGERNVTRE